MGSIGGSMVLSVPSKHLTVAITVNLLTADRSSMLEVVDVVAKHYRLGIVSSL